MTKDTAKTNLRRKTFDNEDNILSMYRGVTMRPVYIPLNGAVDDIFNKTHSKKMWKSWVSSAGKSDKTPDYYSKRFKLMMEVMRMDDKAYETSIKKGVRVINHTLAAEFKVLKELADSEILDSMPKANVFIIADSGLTAEDDHNFIRYRANFLRVLSHHGEQVDTYRKNHPGYKLIFFVFDETSGVYVEKLSRKGNQTIGNVYLSFADPIIREAIKKSGADFVISYSPYNTCLTPEGLVTPTPKIVVYDVSDMAQVPTIEYSIDNMVSSEV